MFLINKMDKTSRILGCLLLTLICFPLVAYQVFGGNQEEQVSVSDGGGFWHRFQLEFYGGFSSLNPKEFNLIPDRYDQIQSLRFDEYYQHLYNAGSAVSWDRFQEGEYRRLKWAFPFGLRLKFAVNDFLFISFGFKSLDRNQASHVNFEYTQITQYDEILREVKEFSPFALSVQGYIPQLGIHFRQGLSRHFGIEGYILGGPLYVNCAFFTEWSYKWGEIYENSLYSLYETEGLLEENGEGTGISLELGGRLNWNLGRRVGLFLESGYAYQRVSELTGDGRETQGSFEQTWQGDWAVKSDLIQVSGQAFELVYPTSFWPDGQRATRERDFILDLSGFQVRMGFSFRF